MADTKAVLGRGLAAIFTGHGLDEDRPPVGGQTREIPVRCIETNPFQPRQDFGENGLQELARSIKALGIIQPLTVRAHGDDRFELIAGERRLRAAKLAELTTVPAYVRTADTEAMLEMSLVENLQREDLNPVEIALGYQRLIDECGLRQAQVAERVGMARSAVSNTLRLLRLPPHIQAALRQRAISAGHGRALIGIGDEAQQMKLLHAIQDEGLSVRQTEKRAGRQKQKKEKPGTEPYDDRTALEVGSIEDRLRKRFSTKTRLLYRRKGGGKIELHYFSDEELERILELLLP